MPSLAAPEFTAMPALQAFPGGDATPVATAVPPSPSVAASPALEGFATQPTPPQAGAIPSSRHRVVTPYTQGLRGFRSQHEQFTRMEIVRRIARLQGCEVGDEFAAPGDAPAFLVPIDTLVAGSHAVALGLTGRDDLFGGVVPHAFVATKAISHPLVSADAAAPLGWNPAFHEAVSTAVLRGYSVFSHADALRAASLLLTHDRVRVKRVHETGGRGQCVVPDLGALQAVLEDIAEEELLQHGLVLEQDLDPVETFSVGQVHLAGITATYHGRQHLTRNHQGHLVYGGSELTVVRGGFDTLLTHALPDAVRVAVEQALVYDTAVAHCYPGFFASRINYDIAQGRDAQGRPCSGVLEQSWRVGGATGAEIAALEVLAAEPSCHRVRTHCVEAYGDEIPLPEGATLYFQGEDDQLGAMLKYAEVLTRGDPA